MVMKIQRSKQLVNYENVVIEFIEQGGALVSCSDDATFNRVLKDTVYKQLAVKKESVFVSQDKKYILNVLSLKAKSRQKAVLFTERLINGRSALDLVEMVKGAFDGTYVIVLTNEAHKSDLAILHESGVDNFITKPLNINTLIEKVAFTVKPQGKIGQLIDKAKQLLADEQYSKAMAAADKILTMKPNSASALMLKGDAYKKLGEKQKAVNEYEKAHQSAQMYLEPLKRLADFYKDEGDSDNQLNYLAKLDELSPLNVNRKVTIGGLHMDMGQKDEGKRYFGLAVDVAAKEAAQNASNVAMQIAERLIAGDPEAAEGFYRKALRLKGRHLDRGDVETFNRLGIALRRQKKPKAAVKEYTKALQLAPDDENLYYNLAMANLEGGQFDKALENIETVLKLNRGFAAVSAVLSYNIGMIYYKSEDLGRATSFFNSALEIDPDYAPARRMLAKCEG